MIWDAKLTITENVFENTDDKKTMNETCENKWLKHLQTQAPSGLI